jgi:hypothetical protein
MLATYTHESVSEDSAGKESLEVAFHENGERPSLVGHVEKGL